MTASLCTVWRCDKCGDEHLYDGDALDALPAGWAAVALDFEIQEWCSSCALTVPEHGAARMVAL